MQIPLVTVIIPSYNHAQYIQTAIESVFAQTYSNIELIVNDDGSVDGTHDVLEKYSGYSNVRIIQNKGNRGQGYVLNESIAIASGEFISILPSDDWYLPDKTALQVRKFQESQPDVCVVYGSGSFYDELKQKLVPAQLNFYKGDVLERMVLEQNFVHPVTPMFRKKCFEKVRFDESYRAEGEGLFIRLSRYCKFDFVTQSVGVMRTHNYNTGANVDLMCSENHRWWNDFFLEKGLPPEIKRHEGFVLGRLKRMYGLEYIARTNNRSKGRRLLIDAIFLNPQYLLDWKVCGGIALTLFPTYLTDAIIKLK